MTTTYATAVLLVTEDDLGVWLAVRATDAKFYPCLLECPAGKPEDDEAPHLTALREVYEETGVQLTKDDLRLQGWLAFKVGDRQGTVNMTLFIAATDQTPKDTEPGKRTPWIKFPAKQFATYTSAEIARTLTPATAALLQHHLRNLRDTGELSF